MANINDFKAKDPKAEFYIMTPLPVWAKKQPENENLQGRKDQLSKWVIPTIKEIAKEENIPLINVHKLMKKGYQYTTDGGATVA